MPQVVYTFSASGQAQVAAAFKSISSAASASASATKSSLRAIESQAKRTASKKRSVATTAASAEVAAEQKAASRRIAIDARISKQRARNRLKRIRGAQRAARQEVRIAERAASAKVRAEARASKRIAATRRRLLAGAGGAALRGAAVAGGIAGGLVGTAARDSIRLQDQATRIAIKGSGSVGQRDAQGNIIQRTDPTTLRKSFERTATQTGVGATDVAAGVSAFVTKTGDLGQAQQIQDTLARISVATGTDMAKLGDVAADLFQKFDVTTVSDMNTALSTLAVQGKRGAFEMEDLAKNASKLTAAAQFFGGGFKGVEGVSTLGGLTQIARQATPSGEEAATSVNALFTNLLTKSKQIKKATGADVFTDDSKTQTNSFRKVITDVISGSGGNKDALSKIFGKRGIKAISPLVSGFNEARFQSRKEQRRGGGTVDEKKVEAAGLEALNAALDRAIASTGAVAQINDDYAASTKSSSFVLNAAWESLKATVGAELTPVLARLIQKFASLATNTNAVDSMVTVFVALAEAAELAVDALRALGLIKKKESSPALRLKAEQSKLARLKDARSSAIDQSVANKQRLFATSRRRALTSSETAELSALEDPVRKIDAQIKSTRAEIKKQDALAFETPAQQVARDVSGREQFVAKFLKGVKPVSEAQQLEDAQSGFDRGAHQRSRAGAIFDEVVAAGAKGEGVRTRGLFGDRFGAEEGAAVSDLGTQIAAERSGTAAPVVLTEEADKIKRLGDAASQAIAKINAAAKASVADGG